MIKNMCDDIEHATNSSYRLQQKNVMEKVIAYLKNSLTDPKSKRIPLYDVTKQQNCPNIQATKLLLSDFVLHHEYFFTFSVFVAEVPFLSTIKDFSSYMSQVVDENATTHSNKPHFNSQDAKYILQALGFHSDCRFIQEILNSYERNSNTSFLSNIFQQLTTFMEKYCLLEGEVDDLSKKIKYYEQLVSDQKMAIGGFQNKLKKQDLILSQHREYIEKISEKEKSLDTITTELNLQRDEINKLKNTLKDKEDDLRTKEHEFEENKSNTINKLEQWSSNLKSQQNILEEKYQKFLIDKTALKKEKEHFKMRKENFTRFENAVVLKYEQKLKMLESELVCIREVVNNFKRPVNAPSSHCNNRVTWSNNIDTRDQDSQTYDLKPAVVNRSQQTSEITSVERFEDASPRQSKSIENGRSNFVRDVLNEMNDLKKSLNVIRDELNSLKQTSEEETEEKKKQLTDERAYEQLKRMYKEILSKNKNRRTDGTKDESSGFKTNIGDTTITTTSSSSGGKLTDDVVIEDARYKLRELEKESESLNKNFQHLQSILTRNLAWNTTATIIDSPGGAGDRRFLHEPGLLPPSPRRLPTVGGRFNRLLSPWETYYYGEDDSTDTSPRTNVSHSSNYRIRRLSERRPMPSNLAATLPNNRSTMSLSRDDIRYRSKCAKKLQFDSVSDLSSTEEISGKKPIVEDRRDHLLNLRNGHNYAAENCKKVTTTDTLLRTPSSSDKKVVTFNNNVTSDRLLEGSNHLPEPTRSNVNNNVTSGRLLEESNHLPEPTRSNIEDTLTRQRLNQLPADTNVIETGNQDNFLESESPEQSGYKRSSSNMERNNTERDSVNNQSEGSSAEFWK